MEDYIKIDYETEIAVGEVVKKKTTEIMKDIKDKIDKLVWEVANNYIGEHLELDIFQNYTDKIRNEVIRCSHIWVQDKENYYGKQIRKALLEDHKEVILNLIRDEHIAELEKQIKSLKEQVKFHSGRCDYR